MVRHTSGMAAGPACAPRVVHRFTFAVRLAVSAKAQAKRTAEIVDHVEGEPGAMIVEERIDGGRAWLTVAMQHAVRPDDARRMAEGCPHVVLGTFAAE
jgi:hypothetical protein